jgi:hypothetical protein
VSDHPLNAPSHLEQTHVGFEQLIEKVRQAEVALEAKERQTGADWRQVKASWRAMWTPGRIVIAGLVSGFIVGRAEPFKKAAGGGTLQLISALSSLFAGGSAQAAASEASDAKQAAETVERKTDGMPPPANDDTPEPTPPYEVPETFRGSGHL